MKKIAIIVALFIATATTTYANDPSGLWRLHKSSTNGVDHLNVQFARCGNAYCATIAQAIGTDGRPVAGYPHIGKTIIRNMVHQGSGEFTGGTIWDPRRDRRFDLTFRMNGNRIRAEACANALLCRKFRWQKLR
ncbi:DUF2147 domain-containing protein [Pseudaestuariivita rosea]|uniref:DUF2147 domain-containing protein n=1 Tax=Pseudaestuariivita rosea TaxID=2763263 RepID=UPI001ABAF7E2|nr:DUF2147 domain-containing protein [Pseudaestuariivita rosea]